MNDFSSVFSEKKISSESTTIYTKLPIIQFKIGWHPHFNNRDRGSPKNHPRKI